MRNIFRKCEKFFAFAKNSHCTVGSPSKFSHLRNFRMRAICAISDFCRNCVALRIFRKYSAFAKYSKTHRISKRLRIFRRCAVFPKYSKTLHISKRLRIFRKCAVFSTSDRRRKCEIFFANALYFRNIRKHFAFRSVCEFFANALYFRNIQKHFDFKAFSNFSKLRSVFGVGSPLHMRNIFHKCEKYFAFAKNSQIFRNAK